MLIVFFLSFHNYVILYTTYICHCHCLHYSEIYTPCMAWMKIWSRSAMFLSSYCLVAYITPHSAILFPNVLVDSHIYWTVNVGPQSLNFVDHLCSYILCTLPSCAPRVLSIHISNSKCRPQKHKLCWPSNDQHFWFDNLDSVDHTPYFLFNFINTTSIIVSYIVATRLSGRCSQRSQWKPVSETSW